MALEIPDAVHAAGLIAGAAVVAAPFAAVLTPPSRLVTGNGIASASRVTTGVYALTLEQALNGAESDVHIGLGVNNLGKAGGQMNTDGSVLTVTTFDQFGNPADMTFFTVTLLKVPSNNALTLPVLPVPVPGAGLPFSATVQLVSGPLVPGVINQIDSTGGAATYTLPDPVASPLLYPTNTLIVIKNVAAAADANTTIAAAGAGIDVEDPTSGALAATYVVGALGQGMYLAYQLDAGGHWRVVGYSLH